MLRIVHKHNIPVLVLSVIVIYVLQFLILPKCLPQYYPVTNEAWCILIVPLIVISLITNILTNVKIVGWAIIDLVYCIMVFVYNGKGFYGIGMRGVSLDGMSPIYSQELVIITALIIALALFAFQMFVREIRIIYLKTKNS